MTSVILSTPALLALLAVALLSCICTHMKTRLAVVGWAVGLGSAILLALGALVLGAELREIVTALTALLLACLPGEGRGRNP